MFFEKPLLDLTQEQPLAIRSHIRLLFLEDLSNETDTSPSAFVLRSCFNYTHCLL